MILAEAADFPHTVQPSGKWKNRDVKDAHYCRLHLVEKELKKEEERKYR